MTASNDTIARLLRGDLDLLCVVEPSGLPSVDVPRPDVLLPGSFNPLHAGHLGMAAFAARRLGRAAAFELSVVNAEKPPLEEGEVLRRAAQFVGVAPLWLTRAPTFVEKARLFGPATFVVGADTAARVVQPRFYGGSEETMRRALVELRERGCRFIVAGRSDGACFLELGQLAIPAVFADLFEGVPEAEFRLDVSSTALRGTRQR
jgi:hypothetical protein